MVKRKAVISKGCVACGSCLRVCPKGALSIHKGMYATVNEEKCVGCGRCVNGCPAGVIYVVSEGSAQNAEKTMV